MVVLWSARPFDGCGKSDVSAQFESYALGEKDFKGARFLPKRPRVNLDIFHSNAACLIPA